MFNLFHLSHFWFGLSWEEMNFHRLPEPGVGGSPLMGLFLCPPDCLSGQHADLGLFSQENKAFVTLGWLSGVVLVWGPLARSSPLAGPVPQARFGEQG